jgi:hypothetical protein
MPVLHAIFLFAINFVFDFVGVWWKIIINLLFENTVRGFKKKLCFPVSESEITAEV